MTDTDDKKDNMPIIDTGPAPEGGEDHPDTFPDATAGSSPDEDELTPEMAALTDDLIGALKSVYDPEIPVNIYELGLIYKIEVNEENKVIIEMTLTSPNCPVAESLPNSVKENILKIEGINDVDLKLVWDPPWTKDKMSEAAKLELNL